MLERERAVAEEKAAKQRQESLQSAAKLAPWAKKTGPQIPNVNEHGMHPSGISSGKYQPQEENSLSLAEIQRLEEERERERKLQKEIEEQQLREQRIKQDQEEQMRRQQVFKMEHLMSNPPGYIFTLYSTLITVWDIIECFVLGKGYELGYNCCSRNKHWAKWWKVSC